MNTAIEILIDFSGSMRNKLSFAKEVLLNDVVPNLDYSSKIGIKTFAKSEISLQIHQVLPLDVNSRVRITQAIKSLGTPEGGTPISAAISASVATLKKYANDDKKIILVTDGKEDEGGDYVTVAKEASLEGVNCQVHIIGINLDAKARLQALEISSITKGSSSFIYHTSKTSYNSTVIKSRLSNFFNAVKLPTHNSVTLPVPKSVIKNKIELQPVETLIFEDSQDQLDNLEDKEHNEKIRQESEKYLFKILKEKYPGRVKWLNENGESMINHDFEIINFDGTIEYYIECKGTVKNKPTFYLTKNEWYLFLDHTKNYQIYFVQNSFDTPNHVCIDNLLDWLLKGKLVPYLRESEIIKEERVFLTLNMTTFDN